MKTILCFAAFVFAALVAAPQVMAEPDPANPEAQEAIVLTQKAIAMIKEQGLEKAVPVINDPKGPFVKGELYVFVFDLNNSCVAHGRNAKMVGKDMGDLKDTDGVFIIQEFAKTVKSKSKGWVDYKWTNPETKKIEPKTSYVEQIPGTSLYAGCGIYKK